MDNAGDLSEVRAPLSWHTRLHHGTDAERANWRLIGNCVGVHWPDLDEDIGIEGLVLGQAVAGGRSVLGGVGEKSRFIAWNPFVFALVFGFSSCNSMKAVIPSSYDSVI
ncbi:DUF2442 domain-containing protein [bacterium]|nr:DUF2442 domain-containing protein [bacterium]